MTTPHFKLSWRRCPTAFALALLCCHSLRADPASIQNSLLQLEQIQAKSPRGKISDKERSAFWRFFAEVAAKADEPQFLQLAAIFARLPPESTECDVLSPALLSGGLRLAVKKLGGTPVPRDFPAVPSPKPSPKISKDLNAAWNSYRAACQPFLSLVKKAEASPRIEFQTHQNQYWRGTNDLLLQKPGMRTEDFLAYEWGGMCGTGSGSFRAPNSHAVFLSLLQEKRYGEAAGAALALEQGDFGGPAFDAQEFLSLCTPDWEAIAAGGLVENIFGDPENRFYQNRQNLLIMLGAHGGDRSADWLIELAGSADANTQADCIKTLGAFLGPTLKEEEDLAEAGLFDSSLSTIARRAEPVSLATRQNILEFFDRVSGPKAPFETCEAVASSLSQKNFPSAKPILHRLLRHPSEDVSRRAAESLGSIGEEFVPPAPPAPVSFLVELNGEPLMNCQLAWGLGGKSGSVTSEARTTASGLLALPYKYFIDPARSVEFVRISSPDGKSPETPLFDIVLPKPRELDKEQLAPVKTQAFELRLLFPKSLASHKDKNLSVSIQRTGTEAISGSLPKSSFTVPATDRILFPQLQPGAYRIKLNLPGAARFDLDLARLETSPLEVKLEPGSDVQLKIRAPKGWTPENLNRVLLRNGREIQIYEYINYQTGGFSGLPAGEYVLRIPAGKDQRNRLQEDSASVENFGTVDIPFHIDARSPATLDLGEIRLKLSES